METEQKIKTLLYSRDEITAAFIFGSYLFSGEYRDIDIGIFTRNSLESLEKHDYEFEVEQSLSKHLPGIKVDVRVLNDAPDRFLFTVFKGKFLFSKDDSLDDLMERVISKCLDEQFYLDRYYREAYGG